MRSLALRSLLGSLFLSCANLASAQCLEWTTPFVQVGPDGGVHCSATFDDGGGAALYVGGGFTQIGNVQAARVARWNGSNWSALGSGLNYNADALHVYDDGAGPALYAAGDFSTAGGAPADYVARWRNGAWSALGAGPGFLPRSMVSFDHGTGPKLYVGGSVQLSSHVTYGRIRRWDGSSWTDFGGDFSYPAFNGVSGNVLDLAVHDDGSGPALHAAGIFAKAGGTPANGVARWNGSAWVALGAGIPPGGVVESLQSFDDGTGPALYAGGLFGTAGGASATNVACWSNGIWSALGSGVGGTVRALTAHDDGNGAVLYAGGTFPTGVARWNGSAWSALGGGLASGFSSTLQSFEHGGVAALYCAGGFTSVGGVDAKGIARWSGGVWSAAGTNGSTNAPNAGVNALAAHDDGSGRALYVGGDFTQVGDLNAARVARWNGTAWSALGGGLDGRVLALAHHEDANGPALYAGGQFLQAGGVGASRVARWNGNAWSAVGAGLAGEVRVLRSFDDGSGPALYAGGHFPGGVARWDGSSWSVVGSGFGGAALALTVHDDGAGARLYAGGGSVARWNGSVWSAVGIGGSGGSDVRALESFDGGNGAKLYAGGIFQQIGGTFVSDFAWWNGSSWASPPAGSSGSVLSLATFDDGSGSALYIGGSYVSAGGSIVHGFSRFDGTTCTGVGGSMGGGSVVAAIAAWDSGTGGSADLYVGGAFISAGGVATQHFARWRGCGHPGVVVCPGDGSVGPCPCGNVGLPGSGCENSGSTGGASLDSSGWNSLAFDTLTLTSSGELATSTSIFLQGTQQIAALPFGDGLRCAGGSLARLYVKTASAGTVSAPASGDPTISARSAELGGPLSPGQTRVYQVYYRDPSLGFCPEPAGGSFNATNGLRISWSQ